MVYIISYDLNKSGKNYDGVYKAIEDSSTGVWCRPLDSTWLIRSNLTPTQISNNIKAQADSDDFWLVIEVKNNKQGWLTKEMWDYINANIFV